METGENGLITQIAGGGNLTAELDKHWIKEGNEIRVLHRKEPDAHPLMVLVNGVCIISPQVLRRKFT
jgi:Fe2+ transport system protein FeoA